MIRLLTLLTILSFFISSCEIINPAEEIPSYIRIDTIPLTTQATEGPNTCKITDAWVYVDGKSIGAFELPCTFPVLASGKHQIEVLPGIKLDGIAATRAIYQFYQPYQSTVDLTPKLTTLVKPNTSYYSNINFDFVERFNPPGFYFEKTSYSDTNIVIVPDNSYAKNEGKYGAGYVDAAHSVFEFATHNAYVLPNTGKPVFLELDYKCTIPFAIGLYITYNDGSVTQYPVFVVNKSDNWNKTYINLTQVVQREQTATNFKVFFRGEYESDVTDCHVFLDNIKLIHGN